jgi:hypothetical protein
VPCRHCGRESASRPRGLCWPCYYTPAIRVLYASQARYGLASGNRRAPLPAEPTTARPGSEEKIRVLCERAARHETRWHPDDPGYGRHRWRVPVAHVRAG